MGRVDCVSWPGCKCWFWPKDHREPHFHVKSAGEWEIRVFFGEEPPWYDVLWQVHEIPGKKLRRFLEEVAENRQKLFEEWDAKVQEQDP
ncbi:MAG TPA: DUF4160 domain-containing protein [Longimicrobium sp.]|jgi:hypothetical protein